ncbi:hypothetical protein [Luteimonas terricola]|uniref:Mu-like prophage FluMu protein gp28 n=1 Tax=Luteimonas terricola TaxID=645597 RepID=A0ABQ2EGT4_9GAMM|nr:hypothetical protein [Luteimonas terricola]GGK08662.1 hypothetical protein GCM10011394_17560 [Luteimonas terricola]
MNDQARTLVPDTAGAEVPAALLPYQQRWIADPANLKVCEKGRRTGLTWAEAADDVLIAASSKEAGGQNVYYLGTDKEMTEEFIGACAMWSKAFNHAAGAIEDGFWDEDEDDKHIKTYTIRFPASGHKITALASRPRKLRGRQGVLVGDEAAFVDDLPELLKAAMAFLIWGGKVRIISTHDGAENEFNGLVQEIRAGKRRGSVHKVTFRGAVEEGLFERICLRLGKPYSEEAEAEFVEEIYGTYGEDAEEELDCVPRNSAGAYLSRQLVESRMSDETPILRIERPEGWELLPERMRRADVQDWLEQEIEPLLEALQARRREIRGSLFGYDFARYVDLSILAPQIESMDLNRRVPFAIEMRRIPYDQQRQILFYVADRLPKLRAGAMDAVGNGSWLAEVTQQRYGERIHRVAITEGFYGENFPKLKADLQDGTLDGLPRHGDWLDDLRAVENIKGVPRIPAKRTTGRDGGKRHGDAAVALVLGTSVATVEYVPIEFESTGPRFAATDAIGRGYGDTGFGTVPGGNDFGGFA